MRRKTLLSSFFHCCDHHKWKCAHLIVRNGNILRNRNGCHCVLVGCSFFLLSITKVALVTNRCWASVYRQCHKLYSPPTQKCYPNGRSFFLLLSPNEPEAWPTQPTRLEVKKQHMINDLCDMSEWTKWSVHVNVALPKPSPSHLL